MPSELQENTAVKAATEQTKFDETEDKIAKGLPSEMAKSDKKLLSGAKTASMTMS